MSVGKVSPSQRQPLKSEVKSLREQPNEMWLLDFGMCEVCVTVLDVWKRPFGQIPYWGTGKKAGIASNV